MPIKRRIGKRRLDTRAELDAWSCLFECEYDFFNDLPGVGVQTDPYGRVGRAVAKAAWARLGDLFLATRGDGDPVPWALAEFGNIDHA